MQGVILSFTTMGKSGFCTNISTTIDGAKEQLRFRKPGNTSMMQSDVHHVVQRGSLEDVWVPGRRVDFGQYARPVAHHARMTHPEDVIIRPRNIRILPSKRLAYNDFVNEIRSYCQTSIAGLFPRVQYQSNGKPFVPANTRCAHSVGYITPESIEMYQSNGKWYVCVTARNDSFDAILKDESLVASLNSSGNISVSDMSSPILRLALAEAFQPHEDVSSRCYVMVTHVIDTVNQEY
ncbi:MAG: hypothetical protein QF535_05260 [Anaerolineales bacterium]|nr:hypothetical protein [Anaerolineales bacterium]